MSDYLRYKAAIAGQRLPLLVLDLDVFEQNAADILRRGGDLPIRIASKSLRCTALIRHLQTLSPRFRGLMTFTAEETLFLSRHGLDDLLLGYPTFDRASVKGLVGEVAQGKKITFMVDAVEQLQFLASFQTPLRVCLDIDMSTSWPGLWFGVRRSPLRSLAQVQALLKSWPSSLQLVGAMGYEAQVAGLGDKGAMGPVIRLLQRLSRHSYRARRQEIFSWLKERFALELLNGGGTGSLEWTREEPLINELTAGSGFYSPGLFDFYSRFQHRPALFFATQLVRSPAKGFWTALGGGYVASGEIHINKRPLPFLPQGISLIDQEGCGEVQTPFRYQGTIPLEWGDPVFFRHAKAGELCERFNEILILRDGAIIDRFPTYRGEQGAFL